VDIRWPGLSYEQWAETRDTLHLWTQVIGKIKLALTPFLNEWWNIASTLTCRCMTTGPMPSGPADLQIDVDFISQQLVLATSDGRRAFIDLIPRSVAEDTADRAYDGAAVRRWWLAMLSIGRVMDRFRTPFGGKSSPVLFYWGGFDLNHTRFSGRPAPARPGSGVIQAFGEDQENFAAGVETIRPDPQQAWRVPGAGEFVLPWEELLARTDPDAAALEFFTSTYARTPPWRDGTTPRSSFPGSRKERHPDVHPPYRYPGRRGRRPAIQPH